MNHQLETRCVHGDTHKYHEDSRAISFPIYQTASFSHTELGHNGSGFDYTRESNPTRERLEETVASLESAADAVAFTSGMAAISACFELFRPGDHIVCSEDLYGGTVRILHNIEEKNGLIVSFADTTNLEQLQTALRPDTKAIYIETPSNPMMNVTDIRVCARLAKSAGALLIVDNTFLSPYWQNPLVLGADIVLHSGTKFLAGHNDTISGFLCVADPELGIRVRLISKTVGNTLSPFDSWLVLRGLKTLHIRMERQQESALKIANWLTEQPCVTHVFYVGLPNHPGHDINRAQARGAGSMISFRVDSPETARRVLEKVNLITFAESLGGVESLITYPITQTHPDVPTQIRERLWRAASWSGIPTTKGSMTGSWRSIEKNSRMKNNKEKLEQLETLCAVCRELGAEVRYRPEHGCFTAMVWDGWDRPRDTGLAQSVQQQIQRQTAQYSDLVCYCFDPFSTLVYVV